MILAIYLPSLLYGLGQGAIAPILALSALHLGAGAREAALVVAALGVGQILADVPAGAIADRIGERRAMIGAGLLVMVALVGCLFAASVPVLAACVLAIGSCNSVFNLARQSYVVETVPTAMRARALSSLGGMMRVGSFLGPFATAPLVLVLGPAAGYGVHLVVAAAAVLLLLVLPPLSVDAPRATDTPTTPATPAGARTGTGVVRPTPWQVLRRHRGVFARLGTATLLIGAVRASRQVVLPLWAQHVGVDPVTTTVIFGVSGAVDMALFYPSGRWMDLRGRAFVAVPSMALLGVSLLLLPWTTATWSVAAVAMLLGVGNGLGSGIVMTLAADHAPADARGAFLGVWRLFHDGGGAAGPLTLSAVAAVAGLAPAVSVMGAVGLCGAAMLHRWVPRSV